MTPTKSHEHACTVDELRVAAARGWSASRGVNESIERATMQWDAMLNTAALHLLALGCRDVMQVIAGTHHDELWIDCPHEAIASGERMPGRAVYRQTLDVVGCEMSIKREWLDASMVPKEPA